MTFSLFFDFLNSLEMTDVALESWKIIIILILRKGVIAWTK